MVVASPRLFLALCPSFSSSLSVSVSLPAFLPPLYSPIVLIVLFVVLPLALNSSHTHNLYSCIYTHTRVPMHPRKHTYTHTHIYVRSASRVFARSVYHPSISFLLLLSVVLFLLPSGSFLSRAITYECPDLKIVRLVLGRSP